ncbi:MAG: glycosyltransferase family 2 protein [Bacillota bacterium]
MPAAPLKDVSIIVAAYNALEYSKACLQAIRDYTPPGYELLLINNGSTDGTKEFFEQIPGAQVINNEKNRGFAGGYNQGIDAASTRHMVLLNNDCIVSHNWLSNMLACSESEPGIGIVGPRGNRIPGRQRLEREFKDMDELYAFTATFNQPDSSRWFPVSSLSGFCFLLKREVVEKAGFFDEAFGAGTHEDADYCVRTRLAGFKLYCAGDVFVYHFSHRTFIANNIDLQRLYQYNKYLFNRKWSPQSHKEE